MDIAKKKQSHSQKEKFERWNKNNVHSSFHFVGLLIKSAPFDIPTLVVSAGIMWPVHKSHFDCVHAKSQRCVGKRGLCACEFTGIEIDLEIYGNHDDWNTSKKHLKWLKLNNVCVSPFETSNKSARNAFTGWCMCLPFCKLNRVACLTNKLSTL